ncbi:MAG TPA: hypothetical protein PKO30_08215, partial [Prolixibacteraceae bacterium]|nr:hypothetical protein [Prolixibacteraceae bacterium]
FQENAKFLLFDFNGEYNGENSIIVNKKVYNLSTRQTKKKDRLIFKEIDLLDKDLFAILANATEKTQKPFITRTLEFYKKVFQVDDPLEYFKNILRKRVRDIYKMADKSKAMDLIDYCKEIIPPKLDEFDIEIDLSEDVDFNNKNSEFVWNNHYLRSNPDYIENTILFQQINEYGFEKNFISRVIHFLYLQLIYDVFSNRAHNEHIAPAINKLKSFQKEIEEVIDVKSEDEEDDFWDGNFFCVVNLNKANLST